MYVVGQGDSGQLGLGPRVGGATVATRIPFPYDEYNIVHIAAGIAHNGQQGVEISAAWNSSIT